MNLYIENDEQIFQKNIENIYEINPCFENYILSHVSAKTQVLEFDINTKNKINKNKLEIALTEHFKIRAVSQKNEIKKTCCFVAFLLVLGFIGLFLLNRFLIFQTNHPLFNMLLEIATWVFVWEAIDTVFIELPKQIVKYKHYKNLSLTKIKIKLS